MKKIIFIASITFVIALSTSCKWLFTISKQKAIQSLEEPMNNPKNSLVLMSTSLGDIFIEIYEDRAPNTSKNFLELASGKKSFIDPKTNTPVTKPYFNGIIFHRVIPNFMIQGGDIMGNGTGGPGYQFEDEMSAVALGLDQLKVKDAPYYGSDLQVLITNELQITSMADYNAKKSKVEALQKEYQELSVEELLKKRGYSFRNELQSLPPVTYTLAMANAGPNTNGSQFFINLVDNKHLYGKHTVFGKVLKGRDITQKIANVQQNDRNKPIEDITIKKVIILQ